MQDLLYVSPIGRDRFLLDACPRTTTVAELKERIGRVLDVHPCELRIIFNAEQQSDQTTLQAVGPCALVSLVFRMGGSESHQRYDDTRVWTRLHN